MKYNHLENMIRGWFIGPFHPSVLYTSACEVAVKFYNKGDYESKHIHKIATEVTLILEGTAQMNQKKLSKGEIITILPGEATDFLALTQVTTLVIKVPGVQKDKYHPSSPLKL